MNTTVSAGETRAPQKVTNVIIKMEMKAGASSGMGRIKGSFIFQSGYQLQSSCQSFENVALLELAGAAAGALSAA